MGSIVATETSTVTFISVPGFAFGGDLTFLQLAMGYVVGRILITVLLLPGYFRRQLLIVYQMLFTLFLLIGIMLYVFYVGHAPGELAALTVDGRLVTDRVFPHFIVTRLPPGLVGLVVAAVFAAAMSTLSSSLNSLSAASLVDFYRPWARREKSNDLLLSRLFTALWGIVQIAVALAAIRVSRRVVDEVLGIASFTNGIILGVFLLGGFTRRVRQRAAFAGILIGTIGVLVVAAFTSISWQWYVLIGSAATFLSGIGASYTLRQGEVEARARG